MDDGRDFLMLMLIKGASKENSVCVSIPQRKVKSPPAGDPVSEVKARGS